MAYFQPTAILDGLKSASPLQKTHLLHAFSVSGDACFEGWQVMLIWAYDIIGSVCNADQKQFVIQKLIDVLKSDGLRRERLERQLNLYVAGRTDMPINSDEHRMLHLIFLDRQYFTYTGNKAFVSLIDGTCIPKLSTPPVESICYDLVMLFVIRYTAMEKQRAPA